MAYSNVQRVGQGLRIATPSMPRRALTRRGTGEREVAPVPDSRTGLASEIGSQSESGPFLIWAEVGIPGQTTHGDLGVTLPVADCHRLLDNRALIEWPY